MKKTLLAILLSTNSFYLLAESIKIGDWKYTEIDNSHYAITDAKYTGSYITYKNEKLKEKFSYISNIPCNYVSSLTVNDKKTEFFCNRNKWGNLVMTFPESSDKYLYDQFKKSSSVKIKLMFIDGSDGEDIFSAIGFTKASSKGAPKSNKALTIEQQKDAAMKEAKNLCAQYKAYPDAHIGCMQVHISNNYPHLWKVRTSP